MKNPVHILLLIVLVCLFISSLHEGLDGDKYVTWGNVAKAHIFASVTGSLPSSGRVDSLSFFQWSAGPGLLIAPFLMTGADDKAALLLCGGACALGFWLCLYASLRECVSAQRAVLGVAIAFVATPLGYYARSVSSETLSLLPVGILLLQTVRFAKGKPINWWVVACATGLLLVIRSYLGVFAWPLLFMGLWHSLRTEKRVLPLALSSFCIAAAIVQIAVVHEWMTGSYFRSPYSFGDGEFRSIDPRCPHLWNVLFDPFHGLLPAHPLVGIGWVCMAVLLVRSFILKDVRSTGLWAFTLVAVAINVYVQGCWYYWWMSDWSFGSRGLVLTGVPGLVAFVILMEKQKRWHGVFHATAFVCGCWSFLLMMQGPTSYLTWVRLLEGQWSQFADMASGYHALALVAGGALVFWLLRPETREEFFIAGFITLISIYLFDRADGDVLGIVMPLGLALFLFVLVCKVRLPWQWREAAGAFQWTVPAAFGSSMLLFMLMATHAQAHMRHVPGKNDFQVDDARMAAVFLVSGVRPDFTRQGEPLRAYFVRCGLKEPQPSEDVDEFTYTKVRWYRVLNNHRYP